MKKINDIIIAVGSLAFAYWCDNSAAWLVLGIFAYLMVFGRD